MVVIDGAAHVGGAAHMAAAWEIARELSLAGAEDDSRRPSSVEGSPTPLPKFASYLARVRLGAV